MRFATTKTTTWESRLFRLTKNIGKPLESFKKNTSEICDTFKQRKKKFVEIHFREKLYLHLGRRFNRLRMGGRNKSAAPKLERERTIRMLWRAETMQPLWIIHLACEHLEKTLDSFLRTVPIELNDFTVESQICKVDCRNTKTITFSKQRVNINGEQGIITSPLPSCHPLQLQTSPLMACENCGTAIQLPYLLQISTN